MFFSKGCFLQKIIYVLLMLLGSTVNTANVYANTQQASGSHSSLEWFERINNFPKQAKLLLNRQLSAGSKSDDERIRIELKLAHISIVQGKLSEADEQLISVVSTAIMPADHTYFLYLNALLRVNQFRYVEAMDYLQRLKNSPKASVIDNDELAYSLLYGQIYLGIYEQDLLSTTLLGAKSLVNQDKLGFCQFKRFEAATLLNSDNNHLFAEVLQSLEHHCLQDSNSLTTALTQRIIADIKSQTIGHKDEVNQLLSQAAKVSFQQDALFYYVDAQLLLIENYLMGQPHRANAILDELAPFMVTNINKRQLSKFYFLAAKNNEQQGELKQALVNYKLYAEQQTNIEKSRRHANASFLEYRVEQDKKYLQIEIDQVTTDIAVAKKNYDSYKRALMIVITVFIVILGCAVLSVRRLKS